jgi:TfoX/Sxy family transcriptional regulator of competence genes
MKLFHPTPRQTLKSYYEVPAEVIEDTDQLVVWARRAMVVKASPARKRAAKKGK